MSENLGFQWTWLLVPLVGFVIGLYVSMVGGGGGIFFVPALTILFGLPTQLAASTSLASVIPTTIVSTISPHRNPHDAKIEKTADSGCLAGKVEGANTG